MRLTLAIAALLLFPGAYASGQQAAPEASDQLDLSDVRAVIVQAESHLGQLDRLIAAQEERLDALYDQRDAASEADARDRGEQFDSIIDQMNLTLTNLEAERDRVAAMIVTVQRQLSVLDAPETAGIEE